MKIVTRVDGIRWFLIALNQGMPLIHLRATVENHQGFFVGFLTERMFFQAEKNLNSYRYSEHLAFASSSNVIAQHPG